MKYNFLSQFILRVPLLPYNLLSERLHSKEELQKDFFEAQIQEAIYLASPVLYNELQKLLREDINNSREIDQLLSSLSRYINRMSTRCTPFGLFASCSVGEIGTETNIVLQDSIHRKTRLDMHFLSSLYDTVIKIPEVKNKIKYYPNTSLYPVGKKYRYVECLQINTRRKYQIAEIEKSSYLKKLLKIAKDGADISSLSTSLVNYDISLEEATSFVDELIDSQVIVGELSQSVTGDDFFTRIIQLLDNTEGDIAIQIPLKEIDRLLKNLDIEQSNKVGSYEKIETIIKEIKTPYENKFLFQVDTIRNTSKASLGNKVIDEIKSTINFLNKITPSQENTLLNQFKKDFYTRYEEKEIPLMEALDPELGVGYPSKSNNGDISPLISGFPIPQRGSQKMNSISAFQSLLLKKLIKCLSDKEMEIELIDEDVKTYYPSWNDLPTTMYAMFELLQADEERILLKIGPCGGSNAANLLARFAHADKNIAQFVNEITVMEQELMSDVILAEIVHSPEARIGNILSRPHIREYELLYLASSDLPQNKLIYLSDLMVSIKRGRLVIKSKRLNKEIIPRLTNAHNYRNNPMPVYQFLCDMQVPIGRNGLGFSWGTLANEFEFRPRVRYKNTILSAATWIVKINDIKHLFDLEKDESLLSEVKKWKNTRNLPHQVLMPDGDNVLFVDWQSVLSIRSLFSIIKKRQEIRLEEFLFDEKVAVVKGEKGVYTNECIVAFYKDNE